MATPGRASGLRDGCLVAHLLADLGVIKSHSRPHSSNDNPYSGSPFRTLKCQPAFPESFRSFEYAHTFFGW